MKGFFYSNQSLVIVLGSVLFLVILYFIIKALPTKVAKKQAKIEKKEEPKQEPEMAEKNENVEEEKEQEEKKDKKADKKPKIVQVFKRESRVEENPGEKKKVLDPIYDRNVEFVNTSKNIAKFKSFADGEKEEESVITDEFGFVQDTQEDCDFCEVKVKHFDHSRRLSKAIKEDNFDNMFDSHLSEKYLNINSDRHLNLSGDFEKKLFERTEQMMKDSDDKVTNDGGLPQQKFSLFSDNSVESDVEEFEDDNVEINMKTALLSEVYFGKRKKTNNKK